MDRQFSFIDIDLKIKIQILYFVYIDSIHAMGTRNKLFFQINQGIPMSR